MRKASLTILFSILSLFIFAQQQYNPTVAWSTIVTDVVMTDTTYNVTVEPYDINDVGSGQIDVGFYLQDFVGHKYSILEINVDANPYRIKLRDDFHVNESPQTGQMAFVYKSVGDGEAPYIAPINDLRLDQSARDYSKARELDILWREKTGMADTITVIATRYDITGKVDKVTGKALSSNDFTDADSTKLLGIAAGANVGVVPNTAITGATKTKITYDAKGLVTGGADATTADIAASTDKNYVTDAQLVVIGNTSGTNTGDQTIPTTLPASDVYSWAKASTKPSYNTSEVTESGNLYFTDARVTSSTHAGLTTTAHGLGASAFHADNFFAPASGSTNYIQNQNASAQSANMWISGNINSGYIANNYIGFDYDGNGDYRTGISLNSGTRSLNIINIMADGNEGFRFISGTKASNSQIASISPTGVINANIGNSDLWNSAYTAIYGSTLTNNYIPKWDGSKMVNSVLFDSGGLQINKASFSAPSGSGGIEISFRTDDIGYISSYDRTNATFRKMFIDATPLVLNNYTSDPVLVGYSTDPTSGNKLAVNGNAYVGGTVTATGAITAPSANIPEFSYDGSETAFAINNTSDVSFEHEVFAAAFSQGFQQLSGTTVTYDMEDNANANITLTGNTIITFASLKQGMSGNLTVINPATVYTLTFAGGTIKINPSIYVAAGQVITSGSDKIDVFSWYYDGAYIFINGTNGYL